MPTKEERTKHATDISNQYVHKISPDNTAIMKEIRKLPIQDIITIYSNAAYALEEGLFTGINLDALNSGDSQAKRYADAIEFVKCIVIDRLKTATQLWTVTDKITKSPFIDDVNHVWIFTEKELADICVDHYMQEYRTTFSVAEISKENIIKFFRETAYIKGAEYFRVDIGGYAGMKLKPEWIVDKPDFSEIPFIQRPIMNPDFFRSVAKLLEEKYYRVNYEGKKEKLGRFEDDMIKSFYNAMFLIPVKGMEQIKQNIEGKNENGEKVLTKGTKIYIPSLSKGEDDNISFATPAFTDWGEFNKVYSQDEWGGWIWTSKDLLSVPEDIICLNAGSLCFEMSKKMIQQMIDIYEKEFANPKTGGSEAISAALNVLNKK